MSRESKDRRGWRPLIPMAQVRVADAVAMRDWHAEVAEYRLRHQGIKPELREWLETIALEGRR